MSIRLEHFGEAADAFGGAGADDGDAGGDCGRVGVDVVDRDARSDVADEGCGRVNRKARADDDEDVSLGYNLGGGLEVGHGFLKEDDVRPHMMTVDYGVRRGVAGLRTEGVDTALVVDGAHFHQFAVQVEHFRRAGALVEVIDILCNHVDVKAFLEIDEPAVAGVRLDFDELVATVVVEFVDEGGVALKAVGRADVHDGVLFPQTAGISECRDAAFGAHAGAGRDYEFFHQQES